MFSQHSNRTICCLLTVFLLAGCSLPTATPAMSTDLPNEASLRFVNLVDGGTMNATIDDQGQPVVLVQVEVSGGWGSVVYLTADGTGVLDEAMNLEGKDPFLAEIAWYPLNGGGEYDLTANALLDDKSTLQETIHITVTGLPAYTPTPPPLDEAGAQRRVSELIQQEFNVSVPLPTVFRFDSLRYPSLSRWIGSAYYNGTQYYVDLYDDGHHLWSTGNYSDSAHHLNTNEWILCKPAGHYKVLVLYVDYAHLLNDQQAAIAAVPRVADWMNNLYTQFAITQGLSASPLSIEAQAAFVGPPPNPGEALTSDQIRSLTSEDPAAFDILIEIDLDPQASFASAHYPGVVESGGGLALQGCAVPYEGAIHIWSSMPDESQLEGALVMDFNHELSHVFGMKDNWPIPSGSIPGPMGEEVNDWIPYPLFGWTDVDEDGVIEILDPTPYGTNGPRP